MSLKITEIFQVEKRNSEGQNEVSTLGFIGVPWENVKWQQPVTRQWKCG